MTWLRDVQKIQRDNNEIKTEILYNRNKEKAD